MSCGSATCTSSIAITETPLNGMRWPVFPWPRPYAEIRGIRERWLQRQALRELDDRLHADIGLTREQALEEADKPFWR